MKHSDSKKSMAQQLYILGNQTKKAICEIVKVTPKTLDSWIEKYEWDAQKDMQTITKKQLLADTFKQLQAVNEKIKLNGNVPTKELYDAKNILGREIDRLSDAPLAIYTDVFSSFIDFLMRNHPVHVPLFATLSMDFIENKNANG
ncbi:hypothetical protein ACFOWM_06230 [Ferruginibacter yonginensis]|uniref:Terminase ATPase subunit N-terminal domain-containing protein n=1 Tax=Ferruginibacter yonginensis TaxID=1310416 RepID=A0ABV8QQU8_9BACT